jgi:signal peptidase II
MSVAEHTSGGTRRSRFRLVTVVVGACIVLDQLTKSMAQADLAGAAPLSFFHDTFRLQYALNHGAFLSLGAALPDGARFWLFTVFNAAVLAGILAFVLLRRRLAPGVVIGLSLIAGGGIGNLIDRIVYHGAVVDFMNLGIGMLRTGVFNLADTAITGGAAIVILLGAFRRDSRRSTCR